MRVLAIEPGEAPQGIIVEHDGRYYRWIPQRSEWVPAPAGPLPALIKWGWHEPQDKESDPRQYPNVPFAKVGGAAPTRTSGQRG